MTGTNNVKKWNGWKENQTSAVVPDIILYLYRFVSKDISNERNTISESIEEKRIWGIWNKERNVTDSGTHRSIGQW